MATGEDQPEAIVGDLVGVRHVRRWVRCAERRVGEGVDTRAGAAGPAQVIQRPPSGRGEQPGARTIRDAIDGPVIERLLEGLLNHLLGRVDVAHDPQHRGNHPRVLEPEELGQAHAHALVRGRRLHELAWYAIR